jgi:hypothetical protein
VDKLTTRSVTRTFQVREIGPEGSHGGVFVYKRDSRVPEASKALEDIRATQVIRGELHEDRQEFLSALHRWNSKLDDENAYLCIYAHAGLRGINCYGQHDADLPTRNASRISWGDLALALPNKVEMIWILGCKTELAMTAWRPLKRTVARYLFVTRESANFVSLLPEFAAEVQFDPIIPYDRIREHLRQRSPVLAQHTDYYEATPQGFVPAFETNP